jgi:hypothetical protein
MKHKRPQIAKAILSKSPMLELSQYPTSNYIQSHNNKNSMVLVQKQTGRPMD